MYTLYTVTDLRGKIYQDWKRCYGDNVTMTVTRYNAAKKDNDFIYHEKVPPLDSLPEIKGICTARPNGADSYYCYIRL